MMRRATKILLYGLAAMLLLGAVLFWLAGREATLRYAFERVAGGSDGELAATGLVGGLYEGVSFDTLTIKSTTHTITLSDVRIRWEPTALALGSLLATHAEVGKISVAVTGKSSKPVTAPAQIELPIDLILPALKVNAIEYRDGDSVTRLGPLSAAVQFRNDAWRVEELSLSSPWGTLAGRMNTSARPPFAIDAELIAEQKTGQFTWRAPLKLTGNLSDLNAASSFVLQDAPGNFSARLTPFAAYPLAAAKLDMPRFALRRWDARLPEADLSIAASVAADAKGVLQGALRVDNAQPGPIDAQRLPLKSLSTRIGGVASALGFEDLQIDLGDGGKLTGKGSFTAGKPAVSLNAQAVNLQLLNTNLIKTRINGSVDVAQSGDAAIITAALNDSRLALTVDARIDATVANIRKAELRAGDGTASLTGLISMKDAQAFELSGTARAFNPADFGAYPAGTINAALKADGTLAPAWRVNVALDFAPSKLSGKPLGGAVSFSANASAIERANIAVNFGANRLNAKGGMSEAGTDKLVWQIEAPRLTDLHAKLSGKLSGKGEISGSFTTPRGNFALDASALKFAAHEIQTLSALGSMVAATKAEDAGITLEAALKGYRSGQFNVDAATLRIAGTRGAHTVKLALDNRELRFSAAANGALSSQRHWRGMLTQMQNQGNVAVALRAPAALSIGQDTFELGPATFTIDGGRLALDQLRYAGGEFATRGTANAFPLALAADLIPQMREEVNSSLLLGAEWQLALGQAANGSLRIFRESGDVVLRKSALALGLAQAELAAKVRDGGVTATLDLVGQQLGSVRANATTQLARRSGRWGVASEAALQGSARLDVPTLDWLALIVGPPDLQLGGSLRAALDITGSVGKPVISGSAHGERLALSWPQQGVSVKDGVMDLQLTDNLLTLKRFELKSGTGSLTAEGSARLDGGESAGQLKVTLAQFEAVSRHDRVVVASGTGSVAFDNKKMVVQASVKADRGIFELPKTSGPTLSDDVVILGSKRVETVPGGKLTTRIDVKLDMGDQFRVKGLGIDGRLTGLLNVVSTDGALPRAVGSLSIQDGTYNAYGQNLVIERGILTFSGPIDNPGINLLALRKGLAVEAGVEVRGTALTPRAKLVSTPSVAETDKLSWLVLGRSMDTTTPGDFSLLSAAASGLLGANQSTSLQARLATSLGVDEFGIAAPSGDQGGLLTVGKRLSAKLYVTYEQGLGKVSNLLKIRYVMSKRWSLQAQTGTDNAVDVFYTWAFD